MMYSIETFLPALPLSLFACIGMIAGIAIFGSPVAWIVLAGLLVMALAIFSFKTVYFKYILTIAVAALGAYGRTYHLADTFESFKFERYQNSHTIQGKITNITLVPHSYLKKCITLYVPQYGMPIQIYAPRDTPGQLQDTITIHDIKLKKPANPSYHAYLQKEGILCSLFLNKPSICIQERPQFSITRIIYQLRESLLSRIKGKCSRKTFCLFSTLFLGEKSQSKKQLERIADQFKEWGIVHFLARSGLHLVIFVFLWEFFIAFLPIHFYFKQYLLLFITLIYFVLSWPSISFLRALIIFIFYRIKSLNNRPVHFMHTLALTCCIILFLNPMQLFFLDFQLTFILTGALAWLALKQPVH